MKKLVSILLTLAVAVSLFVVPAVVGADPGYDSSLILENKSDFTPSGWDVITGDSIGGVLDYKSSGYDFNFSLTATGLTPAIDYSLIYYADKEARFTYWGGDNPGAVIYTTRTDNSVTLRQGTSL